MGGGSASRPGRNVLVIPKINKFSAATSSEFQTPYDFFKDLWLSQQRSVEYRRLTNDDMQGITNLPSICRTCSATVENFSYIYTRLYSIMVNNTAVLFVFCFARANKLTWQRNVILQKPRSLCCSRNFHPSQNPKFIAVFTAARQWAPFCSETGPFTPHYFDI
jgi:hypothetical protein